MKLKLQPNNTALIIIDMQVDFCSPDGIAGKNGRGIEPIQAMLPKLQSFYMEMKRLNVLTIFTKYVASKTQIPKSLRTLYDEEKLTPICVEGTTGADIFHLKPQKEDIVLTKLSFDAFAGTQLNQILKEKAIVNLLITGTRSDICIDVTAKRGFAEEFNVIVVKDLIATYKEKVQLETDFLQVFDK